MDRQKKTQAANLLVEYRDELRAELDSINKTIQLMMGAEAPQVPEKQPIRLNTFSISSVVDWKSLSFQDAVLKCLENKPDKAFRASDIAHFLRRKHVQGSDRKSFGPMCATAVRRLVGRDKAIMTTVTINNRQVAAFKFKKQDYLL